MKEFGSDFHTIGNFYNTGRADITRIFSNATFLADGRQCLILVIRQEGWKRLWVPEYFCYEVLDSIVKYTGIQLFFYKDYPGMGSYEFLKQLPFEKGDALLKMNYFGLSECHKESISVPIIEDHSHDLLNRSALYSDADWCIASLRKTLPIAEGGMIWSPKGAKISEDIKPLLVNEELATKRWNAMDLKADYLSSLKAGGGDMKLKDIFRKLYIDTEETLPDLEVSALDNRSADTLCKLDINAWYNQKKKNWKRLTTLLDKGLNYLEPINEFCTPFSVVLKLDDVVKREKLRIGLIQKAVYPAVLWRVPETCSEEVRIMSDCLLSLHCDGRYSEEDMEELACIINNVYNGI